MKDPNERDQNQKQKEEFINNDFISRAPSDVTNLIFRQLTRRDLNKVVSLVCKQWNKASHNKSLWQDFKLKQGGIANNLDKKEVALLQKAIHPLLPIPNDDLLISTLASELGIEVFDLAGFMNKVIDKNIAGDLRCIISRVNKIKSFFAIDNDNAIKVLSNLGIFNGMVLGKVDSEENFPNYSINVTYNYIKEIDDVGVGNQLILTMAKIDEMNHLAENAMLNLLDEQFHLSNYMSKDNATILNITFVLTMAIIIDNKLLKIRLDYPENTIRSFVSKLIRDNATASKIDAAIVTRLVDTYCKTVKIMEKLSEENHHPKNHR